MCKDYFRASLGLPGLPNAASRSREKRLELSFPLAIGLVEATHEAHLETSADEFRLLTRLPELLPDSR